MSLSLSFEVDEVEEGVGSTGFDEEGKDELKRFKVVLNDLVLVVFDNLLTIGIITLLLNILVKVVRIVLVKPKQRSKSIQNFPLSGFNPFLSLSLH